MDFGVRVFAKLGKNYVNLVNSILEITQSNEPIHHAPETIHNKKVTHQMNSDKNFPFTTKNTMNAISIALQSFSFNFFPILKMMLNLLCL